LAGICYIGRVKGGPDFNSEFDKKCVSVKCFITILFTTEIYANWVRKEELERWVT